MSAEEASISDAKGAASLRIIADHARAATFLIADGVNPANEGRGYVLRKILRRGIRHGRLLGQDQPFMHQMVYAVRDEMQAAYPELSEAADRVAITVRQEEQQFARALALGSQHLSSAIGDAQDKAWPAALERIVSESKSEPKKIVRFGEKQPFLNPHASFDGSLTKFESRESRRQFFDTWRNFSTTSQPEEGSVLQFFKQRMTQVDAVDAAYLLVQFYDEERAKQVIDGSTLFYLYETFGLPIDYMQDAARDSGILVDLTGFEVAKQEEQARARASWKGGSQKSASPVYTALPMTDFEGYTALRTEGAKVIALVKDGLGVNELRPGEQGEAVLDHTSFYADSGGQVGDAGWLYTPDGAHVVADVSGATKPVQGVFAHRITAKETIAVGDTVSTVVDGTERRSTMRNHTGTHLIHAALREVLGTHVKQAGSLVNRASAPLRLQPLRRRRARRTAGSRGHREPRNSLKHQSGDVRRRSYRCRGERVQSHCPVWRKVR